MTTPTNIYVLALGGLVLWGNTFSLMAQYSQARPTTNALEISSVSVAGKAVSFGRGGEVKLGTFPENISFRFGLDTNQGQLPIRLRYKLEGYDSAWSGGNGEMFLAIRFYNDLGDQIDQVSFKVHGESVGWSGSFSNSSLTHRRETLIVPRLASRMMVVISSAGPPATEGVYAVANLLVSKSSGKSPAVELLRSPFERQPDDDNLSQAPHGWTRDGNHASMAKIAKVGHDSATKAFAILDDDIASHAEWHNTLEFLPRVDPGDNLVVEWNEMFSMGVADMRQAGYGGLKPGTYGFQVQAVNIFGVPTGVETVLKVTVPPPFWMMPWFWGTAFVGITVIMFGAGRYAVRHKIRREMLRLKHQQALERERVRIAHDIHDDLGARVTQISLLSAMSQDNPALSEKTRADFNRISQMSRELVSALYETVWTVNPENDNLDALGNYLCQMVNQLCGGLQFSCRFHLQDLPRDIQVSSQIRHNISMAVKEAVHNAIKHAHASEVSIYVEYTGNLLTISVQDDGRGFQPADNLVGHGLNNMKQRLEDIGGSYSIESQPGKGTTVHLRLVVRAHDKD
jgi:signal transduction histidine kinase